MILLIGLMVTGVMIALYFSYFVKGTGSFLDRKTMLKEESRMVSCTKCHTIMKRQAYGQQCPECRASF